MKRRKTETLEVRVDEDEKKGFQQAAEVAGIPLSAWVRERLRYAAIRELEQASREIPFLRRPEFS